MDFTCVLAAALFFTGNAILLAFYAKEAGREHFDYDLYTNLDVDTLKKEWEFREQHRPKVLAAGIINGLAWFFFAFPIIQLSWILSQRGSKSLWLHISIAILALVGSFTEWISRLLYIGSSMAGLLIKNDFELDTWVVSNDGMGWKALEVSHVMTQGLIIFIDAFEWICLFIILVFVHISVRRWRVHDSVTFGACWNSMGLFIALLSLLDFVAEVLRLDSFKLFGNIAFWYAAVNRLVMIPIWLLMLGSRLPYATMKLNEMATTEAVVIDAQRSNQR
jgi:hypothetical protein